MRIKFYVIFLVIFYSYFLNIFLIGEEPVWIKLGEAKKYMALNEYDVALNLLNSIIAENPYNSDAYYLLGGIYEKYAGNPYSIGALSIYNIALENYKNVIKYATNLTVPAHEIDAYFNVLDIYDKTLNSEKYIQTEEDILLFAEKYHNSSNKGRIYFRLAEHYSIKNKDLLSLKYYMLAYDNDYRQKLSLFRISLLYRKMRNYEEEKKILLLAQKYDFEHEEPINFEVEKAITMRLDDLTNVEIPSNFY